MAEHSTCIWKGKSGKTYKFFIWYVPTYFQSGQQGNYIYTKKNSEGKWTPIYIGQGKLDDGIVNSEVKECLELKGATHIHVHLNTDETSRVTEKKDLISNYSNTLSPKGCNIG